MIEFNEHPELNLALFEDFKIGEFQNQCTYLLASISSTSSTSSTPHSISNEVKIKKKKNQKKTDDDDNHKGMGNMNHRKDCKAL
jgi:hypothetical protein